MHCDPNTRRGFLRGLVTAPVAAAVIAPAVVIPALPVLAAGPDEDPALLAWGDKVDQLVAAFIAAREQREQAIALYHSALPRAR